MCGKLVSMTRLNWRCFSRHFFYLFTVLYVEMVFCHWLFVCFSDMLQLLLLLLLLLFGFSSGKRRALLSFFHDLRCFGFSV